MSIFSLGRPSQADASTADAPSWWSWNPARPKVVIAPTPVVERAAWWRWNPYNRDVGHAEAVGRRDGYDKGVRHERRVMKRRSHPVIGLVFLLAAASGVGFTVLAFDTGSFAGAGAVVDQKIAEWRSDLMGAAGTAGQRGGQAVQSAGQSISSQSQQIAHPGG